MSRLWDLTDAPCSYPLPLTPYARRTEHVGSRVTCDPAPTGTDDDWLVLVLPMNMHKVTASFVRAGWRQGGSVPADLVPRGRSDRFFSFTQGELNVILTESEHFFERFMLATRVAKKLNLLHKVHRIDLFQAILYGNCR